MSDYTKERWAYIKALRPASRMTHVAKSFIRNPLAVKAELEGKPFGGPEYLALPGQTLLLGRNKEKRERRLAAKA